MTRRTLGGGALLFCFAIGLWAADDPIVGTWKLNLAKSNAQALATFKSGTAKIEQWPNGLKGTTDMVSSAGMPIHTEFMAKYDGIDYPVTGDPYADTIALKRTDPYHADTIWKKRGMIVATAQNVISTDGKTWTETISTRDEQ